MRLLNPNMPRLRAVRPSGGSRTSRVHSGGNSLPTTEIMPVLERKIHPDIMLRAEKFVALHNREGNQNEEALPERSESSVLDIADFMRLEPSERNCPSCREVNDQDNTGIHKSEVLFERNFASPSLPCALYSIPHKLVFQSQEQLMLDSIKWPLSRRAKETPANARRMLNEDKQACNECNQSSLDDLQSLDMCHRRPTSNHRTSQVPHTPESKTGSLEFQPHSTPSHGPAPWVIALPSPYIFGMPAHPTGSGPEQEEEYFDFKETPPPLPPLDHPAFRKGPPSSFKFPLSKHHFPVLPGSHEFGADVQRSPAGRQITQSLPSLQHSRSRKGSYGANKSSMSRSGSSNSGTESSPETRRHPHTRQQSKGSNATMTSSRRSSAKYSAKQVSSIAEDIQQGIQDGSWEVEVSRAMVNLALGRQEQRIETRSGKTRCQSQDAHTSSFGSRKARVKNRASGGEPGLDSPILLRDARRGNQADSQSLRDYSVRPTSSAGLLNSSAVTKHNLRNIVMTNGEPILQSTSSSANHVARKGKEREVALREVAMASSLSRGLRSKGKVRTISSPSFTPNLPPEPEVDVAPMNATTPSSAFHSTAIPANSSIHTPPRREHHKSTPTIPTASMLPILSTSPAIQKSYSNSSGKRKADEAGVSGDKTPPKESREARTTFAPEPRPHRASATSGASSHAPSSFNRSKRVRLTETPDGRHSISRAGSLPTPNDSPPNAKTTGSWSSKGSQAGMSHSSHNYGPPPAASASYTSHSQNHRAPSRRSLSQASVPISALISPHAPSIGRLSTFHMRDPRKPSPIQRTPWSLSLPLPPPSGESRWSSQGWLERGGSSFHAWLFFIGFVLFPLWWIAALLIPIPRTRTLGGVVDAEKGVILDDPQLEHDAKSWRTRCRVMAGVSLLTYVPFIILVAIYA